MPLRPELAALPARLGAALGRFLRWWQRELLAAWDDVYGRYAPRAGMRAQIAFAVGQAALYELGPAGAKELAIVSLPGPANDAAATVGELLRGRAPIRHLQILLPPTAVLCRRVRLPAAVEGRLHAAVGFQLGRLMPLKPERVNYGCSIVGREPERRRLLVEIAESRREVVDAIAGSALAAGVKRVAVAVRGSGELPIHLLDQSTARQERGQRSPERWLAYAAVAQVLAIAGLSLGQYHAANLRLAARVQALQTRAAAAETLRDGLQERVARVQFLAGRVEAPDAAAAIAELTRLLPADAWVFQYQAEGGELQIAGFSRDASALAAELRKSSLFREVALRSAIKAPGAAGERFDIMIHLKAPAAA